jgi:hypothetical protein
MEIKLHLFVGKVRYQVLHIGTTEYTEPVLLTDELLDKVILGDDTLEMVRFVPLEGKKYFTLLGVGHLHKFDLSFKPQ